jgi:hypothetical protein
MLVGIIFIVLGLIGLFVSFSVVYNPLYISQLSMNIFTRKVREHGSGISLKWFWCSLQGKPIDMRSTIIITSGGILMMDWDKFITEKVYEKIAPRIYETKDSILYGLWAAAIRPQKGKLINFLLKTPQVGALMSMSEVDLTISDYVATRDTEEVLHDKKNISKIVADVFGGEGTITLFEENYGIIISDPKLFNLDLGKKSQDAAERLFEVKKFRESMEDLKHEIADPDKRANAILIANGMIKKNVYDIEGLIPATKNIADAFASIFTKKS